MINIFNSIITSPSYILNSPSKNQDDSLESISAAAGDSLLTSHYNSDYRMAPLSERVTNLSNADPAVEILWQKLNEASLQNDNSSLSLLLEEKPDPDTIYKLLKFAVKNDNLIVTGDLLEYRESNKFAPALDYKHSTLIIDAIVNGNTNILNKLIHKGIPIPRDFVDGGYELMAGLKLARRKNYKEIKEILKHHTHSDDSKFVSAYKRVTLSYGLSREHDKNYNGRLLVASGGYEFFASRSMAKSLVQLSKNHPEVLNPTLALSMADMLQTTSLQASITTKNLYDRIHEQKPTLIQTGFITDEVNGAHTASILIAGEGDHRHVMVINRGKGYRSLLEVYKVKTENISEKFINNWVNFRTLNQQNYTDQLFHLSKIAEKQSLFELHLEQSGVLPMQQNGECTWTATEGAVNAFLHYHMLKEKNNYAQAHASAKEIFEVWSVFQRVSYTEAYLKKSYDMRIATVCAISLYGLRKEMTNPQHPVIQSQVDHLLDEMVSYNPREIQNVIKIKQDMNNFTAHINEISENVSNGRSALTDAVYQGNFEKIKELIHKGHNINEPDMNGSSPLEIAFRLNHTGLMDALTEGANLESKNQDGETPLLQSLMWNNNNMFNFILSKNADVSVKFSKGYNLLVAAGFAGNILAITELLKRGVRADELDNEGKTVIEVLNNIKEFNNPKVIEMLRDSSLNDFTLLEE